VFNNTHQGALCTSKQACTCASDLGGASHVTCLIAAYSNITTHSEHVETKW